MRDILTEILLGLFVIGWLLLYWQHCTEIKRLRKDLKDTTAEMVDVAGRVMNLEAAAELWTKNKKRNGRTA